MVSKKDRLLQKRREAEENRLIERKDNALDELVAQLGLDAISPEFQKLKESLRCTPNIPHSGEKRVEVTELAPEQGFAETALPVEDYQMVPEEETSLEEAVVRDRQTTHPPLENMGEDSSDLAHCPTPISIVSHRELRINKEGNVFVICAECSITILMATDQSSVEAVAEADLPNAIVFSQCKTCKETGPRDSKRSTPSLDSLYISPRVFAGARILSIPRKIVGVDVPIATTNGRVMIRGLTSIRNGLAGSYRMMSVNTSLEDDAVAESLLLPYVEGGFV